MKSQQLKHWFLLNLQNVLLHYAVVSTNLEVNQMYLCKANSSKGFNKHIEAWQSAVLFMLFLFIK